VVLDRDRQETDVDSQLPQPSLRIPRPWAPYATVRVQPVTLLTRKSVSKPLPLRQVERQCVSGSPALWERPALSQQSARAAAPARQLHPAQPPAGGGIAAVTRWPSKPPASASAKVPVPATPTIMVSAGPSAPRASPPAAAQITPAARIGGAVPGRSRSGVVVVLPDRPLVTRRTGARRPPLTAEHRKPEHNPGPSGRRPTAHKRRTIHPASGPTPPWIPPAPAAGAPPPGAPAALNARQALHATVRLNPRCATSSSGLPDSLWVMSEIRTVPAVPHCHDRCTWRHGGRPERLTPAQLAQLVRDGPCYLFCYGSARFG
jgi:hypothetical protein